MKWSQFWKQLKTYLFEQAFNSQFVLYVYVFRRCSYGFYVYVSGLQMLCDDDDESDCVLCFHCHRANVLQLLTKTERKEAAFAEVSFSNWKKATKTFAKHSSSAQHREAVEKLGFLKQQPISCQLDRQVAKEQATAQFFF